MSAHPVPSPRLWWLAAGFGVWCSALVFLYALHATGCAYGWSAGTLRLVLVAVVLAHLVAIGWMWHTLAGVGPDPGSGETGAFLHAAFLWTVIASFVATALILGPPLLLAMCI